MALKTKSTYYGLVEQNGPWTLTRKDKERLRQRDPLFLGGGNPAGGRAHAGHASWLVTTGYPHRSDGFSKQAEILNYPKAEKGPDYRSIVSKGSDYRNRVKYNKGVFGIPPGGSPFLKGPRAPGPGSSLQPPSGFFPVQGLAPGSAPTPMEQVAKKEEPMVVKTVGAMDEAEFQDIMNDNDLNDVKDVPAESMVINNVDNGVVLTKQVTDESQPAFTSEQIAAGILDDILQQMFPAYGSTENPADADGATDEVITTETGTQIGPSTTETGEQTKPQMKDKKVTARARDLVAEAVAKDPYTYAENIGSLTGNPTIDAVTAPKTYVSRKSQATQPMRSVRTQTRNINPDEIIIDALVNDPTAAAQVPSAVTNKTDAQAMTDLTGLQIGDREVLIEQLHEKVQRLEIAADQSTVDQIAREQAAQAEHERRMQIANMQGYQAGMQDLNRAVSESQLRGEATGRQAGLEQGRQEGYRQGALEGGRLGYAVATENTLNAAEEVLGSGQLSSETLARYGLQRQRPANFTSATLVTIDTIGETYGEGQRAAAALSAPDQDEELVLAYTFPSKRRRVSVGTSPISTTPVSEPPTTPTTIATSPTTPEQPGPSRGRSRPAQPEGAERVFRSGGVVKVKYASRARAIQYNSGTYKRLVRDGLIAPITQEQANAARSPTR